jgi:hypothetical protein
VVVNEDFGFTQIGQLTLGGMVPPFKGRTIARWWASQVTSMESGNPILLLKVDEAGESYS